MWSTEIYKVGNLIQAKEKEWLLFLNPELEKIFEKDCFKNFSFFIDEKNLINEGFEWGYYKTSFNLQIFYRNKKIADTIMNVSSYSQLDKYLLWDMLYHISSVIDVIAVVYQDYWVLIIPKNISFVWDKLRFLVDSINIKNIDVYSFKWKFLYSVNKKLGKDLEFIVEDKFLEYCENQEDKICILTKDKIIDNIKKEKFCTDWILSYNYINNSTKNDKIVYARKDGIQELPFPTIEFFHKTYEFLKEYNIKKYQKIDIVYAKTLDYYYLELILRKDFFSLNGKSDYSEEVKTKYKQLEENLKILGWEVVESYFNCDKTLKIGYIPELHLFLSWNILKYLEKINNTIYLDTREQKIINIEKTGDFKVLKENVDSIKLTKIINKKDEFNGFLSISSEFNLSIYDKNSQEISKLDLKNVLWDIKEIQDIIISIKKFDKIFWSNILFVWKLWSDKWIFIDKENLSMKVIDIWPILNFSTVYENRNLHKKLEEWNFNRLSKEENTIFNKTFSKRRIKTTYMEELKEGQHLLKNIDCLATFWIKWINSLYEFSNKKLLENFNIRILYMLNLFREQKNLFFSLCYEEKLMLELTTMKIEEMRQIGLNKWNYFILQDNGKINYFK